MIVAVAVLAAACITGTLSQYAQGPTDAVLRNRTTPGRTAHTLPSDRTGIDGYVAVARCSDIGKVYRLTWNGNTVRVMAFDCPGDARTRAWMKNGRVVGEVDFYLARRWGIVGRVVKGAALCEE